MWSSRRKKRSYTAPASRLRTAYLFVFGFGLGLVMQVLTVAVQNVVSSADLGAATSGSASSDPSAVSLG